MKLQHIAEKRLGGRPPKGGPGKVKKKVCEKYPEMAPCSEGFARYVAAVMRIAESGPGGGWKAQLHAEPVVVSQQQEDGTVKKIRVVKYRVEMTSQEGRRMSFKVGRGAGGHPVFTDDRETKTGATQVTNRGPLPGEQYAKAGPERKLTPTAWAGEVERLIGPAEIGKVFVGLVKAGFKPG